MLLFRRTTAEVLEDLRTWRQHGGSVLLELLLRSSADPRLIFFLAFFVDEITVAVSLSSSTA